MNKACKNCGLSYPASMIKEYKGQMLCPKCISEKIRYKKLKSAKQKKLAQAALTKKEREAE